MFTRGGAGVNSWIASNGSLSYRKKPDKMIAHLEEIVTTITGSHSLAAWCHCKGANLATAAIFITRDEKKIASAKTFSQ